jgi:N-methylhydantoinase B
MAVATRVLDPVRYEIFAHRLWAIGEEGRLALQRVCASPIVVQGGECMQSFYDPEGRMILACSGHLRFAAATSDAIRKMREWFEQSPGFFDGDQLFNNDPYIAGSHTYDQMVVKPIFWQDRLIAWTASSSHTADTGGVMRGAATEIYHEGIRILGVKVVEKGEFRNDIFKTIVEQCRDPEYVGLDLKSRIAGNNVSAARFLQLVEQFGPEFVEAAGQKMIDDAEQQARAKLRALPDGTWQSRMYSIGTRRAEPYQVMCTMTKTGEELFLDFDGTSPQKDDDQNSTLPSSLAHVTIALTNTLFWDLPWSDGKMNPVHVSIPEGSILNCRFPAACGAGPGVGGILVGAVMECLAKMVYAGGRYDDVNAGWNGLWYQGGPGFFYGGHNREGLTVAQGLYDIHGGGFGARPGSDGVDTGGHVNIPSGGISDVERIEMQYPFLYFTRGHNPNGAGYGRYRGGDGSQRVVLVYGSQDLSVDFRPYGAIPGGAYGLFGGYPSGTGGMRAIMRTDPHQLRARLAQGQYPTSPRQILEDGWGEMFRPQDGRPRVHVAEYWLITDFTQAGGGFGDPLDREPEAVAHDVATGVYSRWGAAMFFGVQLDAHGRVDAGATQQMRQQIREDRLALARPQSSTANTNSQPQDGTIVRVQPHAALVLVGDRSETWWTCKRCRATLGPGSTNYKSGTVVRERSLADVSDYPLPFGEFLGNLLEYLCPSCGTLLSVEVYCPTVGGPTLIHDISLSEG